VRNTARILGLLHDTPSVARHSPRFLKEIRELVSDRAGGVRSRGERPQLKGDNYEMQYLVSVIDDRTGSATPAEMAATNAFNDRLQAEGNWVFAGGLASPSTATVIDNRSGGLVFTDGPFVESKEYLAGFWIMEAPDHDVALELAAEGSKHCNRRVEVRPFLG
jgi:hypothetical protein